MWFHSVVRFEGVMSTSSQLCSWSSMERSCICEAALNHTGAVSFHILFVWGTCLCTASHLIADGNGQRVPAAQLHPGHVVLTTQWPEPLVRVNQFLKETEAFIFDYALAFREQLEEDMLLICKAVIEEHSLDEG